MPITIQELQVQWQGNIPTLLRHDGGAFLGVVYVRDFLPSHEKRFPMATVQADNSTAFSNIGSSKERIPGFTVECWGKGTFQAVMNNIANEESLGVFTLDVPGINNYAHEAPKVRFGIFEEVSPERVHMRREGYVEVFSFAVTNVEVID